MTHASWLGPLVNADQLREISFNISKKITNELQYSDIEALVVTGTSGCVIGGAVSEKSGLPLIIVRKNLSSIHSAHLIECSEKLDIRARSKVPTVVAMVDDLISTGSTVKKVIDKISNYNRKTDRNFVIKYVFIYGCNHPIGYHDWFVRSNIPEGLEIVSVGNACYIGD